MGKTDKAPEQLRRAFRYDPETGHLHWLFQTWGGGRIIRPGDIAGTLKDGYISVGFRATVYRAHRLAWYLMTDDWLPPKQDIDHINGNRSDNRWTNLRLVTRTQNNMNLPPRSNNKSGHRGISWRADTKKWHARIVLRGKTILLGDYVDIEHAKAARAKAEALHFGEHSYLKRTHQ